MGKSFSEMHPELAPEFSKRNLPLTASDITYGSNKKYWWCGKCGHEWLARQISEEERFIKREKTKTKMLSFLLAAVMVLGLMLPMSQVVYADSPVTNLRWDGNTAKWDTDGSNPIQSGIAYRLCP